MRIPAGTHVILAVYVGDGLAHDRSIYRYRDLHAGRLVEDFRFGRGAIIGIDGPMGGTFPTREVELTPVMSGERAVGVAFSLRGSGNDRFLHLMMAEPLRPPQPIDPRIAWPKHLHVAREKIMMLAYAYKERDITQLYDYLG